MTVDEVFLLCKKYLTDFKYILPGKMVSSNIKYQETTPLTKKSKNLLALLTLTPSI